MNHEAILPGLGANCRSWKNAGMSFNPAGAMDLSGIVAAAKAPPPPPGASYVTTVDTQGLEQLIAASARYPIVLELNSPRANADQLSRDLVELTNEAGGAFLLAQVDIDAEPQLAQALGIQAVPTVIAVIAGQLAPLWQGTRNKAEAKAYLDQLLQVAAANGVTGRAEPVSVAADAGPDPRFAAADAALASGDFDQAVVEFDAILAATPNDPEAQAGRAQAALLARITTLEPAAVMAAAAADPRNLQAGLDAADVELSQGRPEAAFDRLIELIRVLSGPERETVRVRLLELFETVGNSEESVLRARRALMSALF
jgi:putative thioredoxin